MRLVCDEHTTKKDVIKLIRKVMIDKDLKRVDMADRMGGHATTAYNLLNPDYRPDNTITIDTLVRLCDAMDCNLVLDIVDKDVD